MQVKLSASDPSVAKFLTDWLLGHRAFDEFDPALRCQFLVDVQSLNGVSCMGAHGCNVTAGAIASSLYSTEGDPFLNWLMTDAVDDGNGDELRTMAEAMQCWDNLAGTSYQFYAGGTNPSLLDGSDRMVCP